MRKYIEDFLLSPSGKKSSTRLFSYLLLQFFFRFNTFTIILGTTLVVITFLKAVTIDYTLLLGYGSWLLGFDTLVLVAIFVPKYLDKAISRNPDSIN